MLRVRGQNGDNLIIVRRIQLHTTNTLFKHPLVDPVLAYIGGLPSPFVIASDREVLSDQMIHTLVSLTAILYGRGLDTFLSNGRCR
jgi:hypothetical protein